MLWVISIYSVALVIKMISGLFSLVAFVIPVGVLDSIEYFFSFINKLSFIFPIDTLMAILGYAFTFFGAYWFVRMILFGYELIPVFGKKVNLPKH